MDRTSERAFDLWITTSYANIRERLSAAYIDEDAFQETYLTMRLICAEQCPDDYLGVFVKVYKDCLMRGRYRDYRYIHPQDIFFTLLHDEDCEDEQETETGSIGMKEIEDCAGKTLCAEDRLIFNLNYVRKLPYRAIGDYVGIHHTNVGRRLQRITADLRKHFKQQLWD